MYGSRYVSSYGLGFRPVHYSQVIADRPKVDFFEIISENFMGVGGNPKKKLHDLRRDYPIAMHGVGLSIAGTIPFDMKYLRSLKKLMEDIDPFIISDHLCFTTDETNRHSYDLLPIPYNEANLRHVISRVHEVQEFLGRHIVLENPSRYISWKSSEMHEAEFLAELCQASGAGILLDLNNLIVNQKNIGVEPKLYFDLLKNHVRQFHIAGHKIENGFAIDTHDQPVEEAVWSLLKTATPHFKNIPILLEWDDHIPSLDELCMELNKARVLQENNSTHREYCGEVAAKNPSLQLKNDMKEKVRLERIELIDPIIDYQSPIREENQAAFSEETLLKPKHGIEIYQYSYFQRIQSALKDTCPNLYYIAEDEGINAITKFYLKYKNQSHWSLNYIGESLVEILRKERLDFDFGVEQALMADLAYIDQLINESSLSLDDVAFSLNDLKSMKTEDFESKKFCLTNSTRLFISNWKMLPLIQQIASDRSSHNVASNEEDSDYNPPKIPERDPNVILITRQHNNTRVTGFSVQKMPILDKLRQASFLYDLVPTPDSEGFKLFLDLIELGAIKEA